MKIVDDGIIRLITVIAIASIVASAGCAVAVHYLHQGIVARDAKIERMQGELDSKTHGLANCWGARQNKKGVANDKQVPPKS